MLDNRHGSYKHKLSFFGKTTCKKEIWKNFIDHGLILFLQALKINHVSASKGSKNNCLFTILKKLGSNLDLGLLMLYNLHKSNKKQIKIGCLYSFIILSNKPGIYIKHVFGIQNG